MWNDPLYTIVTGKAYYAIGLDDIPAMYILGGRCIICGHVGPVDTNRVRARWAGLGYLRHFDHHLRCLSCGNRHENRFTVVGTYLPIETRQNVIALRVEA